MPRYAVFIWGQSTASEDTGPVEHVRADVQLVYVTFELSSQPSNDQGDHHLEEQHPRSIYRILFSGMKDSSIGKSKLGSKVISSKSRCSMANSVDAVV